MKKHRKFGLLLEDLDKVVAILKSNPNVRKAVLFGSRAKGNFENGSDIDIALAGPELRLDDILDIRVAIEKLSLPYKFDIIIYDRIKDEAVKDHIDRVGIALFSKG